MSLKPCHSIVLRAVLVLRALCNFDLNRDLAIKMVAQNIDEQTGKEFEQHPKLVE